MRSKSACNEMLPLCFQQQMHPLVSPLKFKHCVLSQAYDRSYTLKKNIEVPWFTQHGLTLGHMPTCIKTASHHTALPHPPCLPLYEVVCISCQPTLALGVVTLVFNTCPSGCNLKSGLKQTMFFCLTRMAVFSRPV